MADPNNVVIHDHKLVVMFICKAGNTSVRHALTESLELPHRLDLTLPTCPAKAAEQFKKENYYVFGFCRSPYDRVASCYANKVGGKRYHRPFTRKYGQKVRHKMPFSEWVDFICSMPDGVSDQHFRSISYDLVLEGELIPDDVYKIEESGWWESLRSRLIEHSGLDIGPERRANSTSEKPQWTDELRKKVFQRYQEDFRRFGYDA